MRHPFTLHSSAFSRLFFIQTHNKPLLQVDYNKLAGYLGMTNPRSAGNAWGSIKKKLGFGGDAIRSGASTPASGRTASRKRKTGSEDDDEDVDEPTPTKKPRGRAAAGKKGKKSDPEDDYDDVNMSDIPLANSAKKVAAPRGKVVKKTAAKIAKEESSAEEDENSETKLIEDAGEV